jgi:hypothetical protein
MKTPPQLERLRDHEVAQLPPMSVVIRGTLIRYLLPCGQRRCRCHTSKRYRHGPYWYVAVSEGGKKRMVLIPPEHLAHVKRGLSVYARLWEGLCRISNLNLALVKARSLPAPPRQAGLQPRRRGARSRRTGRGGIV